MKSLRAFLQGVFGDSIDESIQVLQGRVEKGINDVREKGVEPEESREKWHATTRDSNVNFENTM